MKILRVVGSMNPAHGGVVEAMSKLLRLLMVSHGKWMCFVSMRRIQPGCLVQLIIRFLLSGGPSQPAASN